MATSAETIVEQKPAAPRPRRIIFRGAGTPRVQHRAIHKATWTDELPRFLDAAGTGSLLPHGLGRSYGDSCLK